MPSPNRNPLCAHRNSAGNHCALHALPGSMFCRKHQLIVEASEVPDISVSANLETSLGCGLGLLLPPLL